MIRSPDPDQTSLGGGRLSDLADDQYNKDIDDWPSSNDRKYMTTSISTPPPSKSPETRHINRLCVD